MLSLSVSISTGFLGCSTVITSVGTSPADVSSKMIATSCLASSVFLSSVIKIPPYIYGQGLDLLRNKAEKEKKQGTVYVEISNISPVEYINDLIDRGEIQNIYLSLEKSRIDDLTEKKPIDSKNKVVLYKKPKYFSKRKLKSLIVDEDSFNALAELKGDDEKISDIKYDVEVDGQKKSISYSNYRTFRISENITNLVVKSPNGHPTRKSLFRAIDARSIEYLKLLNIVGEDFKGEPSNLKNNDCFLDNMTGDDFYA